MCIVKSMMIETSCLKLRNPLWLKCIDLKASSANNQDTEFRTHENQMKKCNLSRSCKIKVYDIQTTMLC